MIKLLHKHGELDEHCKPNKDRTLLKIPLPISHQVYELVSDLFPDDLCTTPWKQVKHFFLQVISLHSVNRI